MALSAEVLARRSLGRPEQGEFRNEGVLGSDLPMSLKFKVNHSKSGTKIPLRTTILTMK